MSEPRGSKHLLQLISTAVQNQFDKSDVISVRPARAQLR